MLVPAMNYNEVKAELKKDLKQLICGPLNRSAAAYEKERRKFKIDKAAFYCKEFEIKTAAKNKWIFFLFRHPGSDKYKDHNDTGFVFITWYHTNEGLRVFKTPDPRSEIIEVFNGHFFKRYNERMQLNIGNPIDIVKHYFSHNPYLTGRVIDKKECSYTMAVCNDGIALGKCTDGTNWRVYNTFISNDITRDDQQLLSADIVVKDEIRSLLTGYSDKLPSLPITASLLRQSVGRW